MLSFEQELQLYFEESDHDSGHNYDHAVEVAKISLELMELFNINRRDEIYLSAMLHDVNDHKFDSNLDINVILTNHGHEDDIEIIKEIISYCGISKHRFDILEDESIPLWKKIVPFADVITATGKEGFDRCITYTKHINRPIYIDTTPIVRSKEEFNNIVEIYDIKDYNGKSKSAIDHIYEKLGQFYKIKTNQIIQDILLEKHDELADCVINYFNSLDFL